MPKMKTHSGAKKRFKPTSGGTQIKRAKQNKNHILNKKTRERKRKLRQGDYVGPAQEKAVRTLLVAGGKPRAKTRTTRTGTVTLRKKKPRPEASAKDGGAK